MTEEQRQEIITLHNQAASEKIYGESLFVKLQSLFNKETVERVFVLSLEWP
jgi:hypothetical protein